MYVDEVSEPQDLRVESKYSQNTANPTLKCNEKLLSSAVPNLLLSSNSPVYIPTSIYSARPTPSLLLSSNNNTQFITANNTQLKCIIKGMNNNTLTNPLQNSKVGANVNTTQQILNNNNNNNDDGPSVSRTHTIIPISSDQSRSSLQPSPVQRPSEKSYSVEQLAAAVERVISGECQPVEAITQYKIPRRTFFRHLKNRRRQLGIPTKVRSKPSSRSASPTHRSIENSFTNNPASGTHLHAILSSMSSAANNEESSKIKREPFTDDGNEVLLSLPNDTAEYDSSDTNSSESENVSTHS